MTLKQQEFINQVKYLYQEKGLTDTQIAEQLGVCQMTIFRTRKKNNINAIARQDRPTVELICTNCEKTYFVTQAYNKQHRYELHLCDDCKRAINQRIIEENEKCGSHTTPLKK